MKDGKEIRYFSMFTGVGGFELGFERASDNKESQEQRIEDNRNLSNTEQSSGGRPDTFSCIRSSDRVCNGIRKGEKRDGESKTSIKSLQESYEDTQHSRDKSCIDRRQEKFHCVGFSEIDKYASELLRNKFPKVHNYGDAKYLEPKKLPSFDMLCGGFPCQAFSIAGKRRGFQDTRGTLFFEIARILEAKRPKIVFLENVKGLLNHEKGKTFRTIIQTISELGYDVQWMVLNSKFFGVPQNRERVFIIGSLRGKPRPEILPFKETSEQLNKRITEGQVTSSLQHPGHSGGNYKGMNMIYDKLGNMKIRRLIPSECERLQGFPDNWTEGFSDTQRYKMMGNAVTVNVVQAIAEKLLRKLQNENKTNT